MTYPWLSHESPAGRTRVVCVLGHRYTESLSTALHIRGPGPKSLIHSRFEMLFAVVVVTSHASPPRAAPGDPNHEHEQDMFLLLRREVIRSACGVPARSAVVCQLSITADGGGRVGLR